MPIQRWAEWRLAGSPVMVTTLILARKRMYTEYFGLQDAPFSIAPNPQYLYMSKRHRDALAHLRYGVQSDGGFILLTGEVGTGKTTLCRCLLEQVPTDVEIAFVLNPRLTAIELLATICDEFSISYPAQATLKTLVDKLNTFLLACHANHRRSVLIIDEAQNLSRDLLEQLRLLTNLETNERKLLQIILLGQPELLDMLDERNLRQFSQRITARFHLEALDKNETEDYVAHRLAIAGCEQPLFTKRANGRIYHLSRGIPRVINLICDRSLLGAYAEDKKQVSAAIVNRAATEVLGGVRAGRRRRLTMIAAGVLLCASVGLWIADQLVNPSANVVAGFPKLDAAPRSAVPRLALPQMSSPEIIGHSQINNAYHDLFVLWGTAFEDKSTDPCELAQTIGLRCHQQTANLTQLKELNRPVIVSLDDSFVTLSSINGDVFTLFAAENQFDLTENQFSEKYSGVVNMLWRMPPAYEAPLKVHDKGAAVDWLVVQLSVIEGDSPPIEAGFVYNDVIESRVRSFQSSVGLTPNGVVDALTWIHINSVEAISIPTLHRKGQG